MSEEIILERCIVCGWTGCDIDHKKDRKTMDFIEACRKVHGYRFGYENTIYVRSSDKVIINCSIHGNFEQNANSHKRGSACKACSGKDPKTSEDNFRKRIAELGGQVIGKYKGVDVHVKCICINLHECNPTPHHIIGGYGMCRICVNHDSKTSEDNFRKRIAELGGQVIGKYITVETPVECICINRHNCKPRPSQLRRGGMCIICAGLDSKTAEDNFRKRITELGGQVIGEYISSNIPVYCKCTNGHDCNPRPGGIRSGQGMCIICSGNDYKTAEDNFRKRITELGGQVIGEYKGNKIKIKCICRIGHECNIKPNGVTSGQGMCKICSGTDSKTAGANFIKRIEKLGGRVIGEYKKSDIRVKCICPKNHECYPLPDYIKQCGPMCQTCSQNGYSQAQISWLNYIQDEENIHIRHAENGGEFRIGKYKVDGYSEASNTVYEFHGDFWHGNPKFYEHTDINPVNKKSFGQLLKATLHKEMSIKKKGYNYNCIWECEWNLMMKN